MTIPQNRLFNPAVQLLSMFNADAQIGFDFIQKSLAVFVRDFFGIKGSDSRR